MPRRIFKDPLQARLKAMERKNPSINNTSEPLFDHPLLYTPLERVEKVPQDPKRHIAKGDTTYKGEFLPTFEGYDLRKSVRFTDRFNNEYMKAFRENFLAHRNSSLPRALKNLSILAREGNPKFLSYREELERIIFAKFLRKITEFPNESKLKQYIEKLDAIYNSKK